MDNVSYVENFFKYIINAEPLKGPFPPLFLRSSTGECRDCPFLIRNEVKTDRDGGLLVVRLPRRRIRGQWLESAERERERERERLQTTCRGL